MASGGTWIPNPGSDPEPAPPPSVPNPVPPAPGAEAPIDEANTATSKMLSDSISLFGYKPKESLIRGALRGG